MTKLQAFGHKGFTKLFRLFQKKYFSLGRMTGTVPLRDFTDEEIEELAGFLALPTVQLKRKGTVSLKQFEEKLGTSAFAHYTLLELVEAMLGEPLITKQQTLDSKEQQETQFLHQLEQHLHALPSWYAQIKQRLPDSRFIWQAQETLLAEIERVAKALVQRLSKGKLERLPIFAQRTTGNPHAFDAQTIGGKLIVHAAFSLQADKGSYPKTTAERVDLLATLGIVQDDLWNFVTCQGLYGFTQQKVHPLWQAAADTASVLNMPMRELMKIDRIVPVQGSTVWVVENSSVASTLMDAHPTAPIICTHGQLRMASWRLLDLLPASVMIYYSGDVDPEGLQIAQKIMVRYQERAVLWRMDEASYRRGKSEALTEARLVKLQAVTIVPEVVRCMQQEKRAAYQEAWLDGLCEDIGRD